MRLTLAIPLVFLLLSPGLALTQSVAAPDIVTFERSVWEAVRNGNRYLVGRYLAPNFQGVYAHGVRERRAELDAIENTELQSVHLSDVRVDHIGRREFALIRYTATLSGISNGVDLSGTYLCTSVWFLEDGRWLRAMHTEVKAAES